MSFSEEFFDPPLFLHPWSTICSIKEDNASRGNQSEAEELCLKDSNGYISNNISEDEYAVRLTVLFVLLTIMLFGGVLAMLSNFIVLFCGLKNTKLFPPEILSLAVTDFLTGLLGTPSAVAIYYFRYTRIEENRCTDQMKVYLGIMYNYKWILPNILKASTCFHLLYFTILSLKDIQRRLKKKKTTQSQHTINAEENPASEEKSHVRPAMCLILIHLLAVVISCTNIYIEQDIEEWCCKFFPFVEVWLTVIFPILTILALNCVIYKKTLELENMRNISLDIAEAENQEDTGNVTSVADVMMRGTSAYSLQAYRRTSKFTTHQAVKIARSPALMVMALLFCYLPLIAKWHMCGFKSFIWSLMAQAMVQANSFMNPFIHAFKVEQFQRALVTFLFEEENSHSGIAKAGVPEPVFVVDLTRGDQDGEVRTVDHIQDRDQDQDTEVRTVQDDPDLAQRSQRTVTFSSNL